MSLDQHKLWMLILGGGGFGLVCLLLAIQEGFLVEEPGDDPPLAMSVLVKLAIIVAVVGLLGFVPAYKLRFERLDGKPWTASACLVPLAFMALGVAAVAGVLYTLVQSFTA